MELEQRLENWGECWRWKRKMREAASYEGRYRSPQSSHWEHGGAPGVPRVDLNAEDAAIVNHAWQSMGEPFHQALLVGWYVSRWSEAHCMRKAWEAAGEPSRRRRYDFDASLAMGKALLSGELDKPAVVRRHRIVARICEVLGFDLNERLDTSSLAVAA